MNYVGGCCSNFLLWMSRFPKHSLLETCNRVHSPGQVYGGCSRDTRYLYCINNIASHTTFVLSLHNTTMLSCPAGKGDDTLYLILKCVEEAVGYL